MSYQPKQNEPAKEDRLLHDILKEYPNEPSTSAGRQGAAASRPAAGANTVPSSPNDTGVARGNDRPNPTAARGSDDSLIDPDMEAVFARRKAAAPRPAPTIRGNSEPGTPSAPGKPVHAAASSGKTAPFPVQTQKTPAADPTQDPVSSSSLEQDLEGESQISAFPEEGAGKRKKRRKKHRGFFTLFLVLFILLVSIILSAIIIVYGRDMLGISSNTSTVIVNIPQGATTEEIAQILKDEGIIERPKFFVFFAGLGNKDEGFRSGDHQLRADMAYETLISELTSDPLDDSEAVTLTFPEGTTLSDAAAMLEENGVCEASEFLDYFNNSATYGYRYESELPSLQSNKFYKMEGYFFPDTYTFYPDMNLDLICQKVLKNFDSHIPDAYYERMKALDITLDETITLASMIQAEAGSTDQMKTISSVFWNRLNNPTEYPLLQSDPTKNYVEQVIKPNIDSYNTTIFTAYDTYSSSGLPPGAICNPGAEAIEAALYPESTDYYYFYSNLDTKVTYFAKTLEEQEANQAKVKQEQEQAEAAQQESQDQEEGGDETAQ